MPPETNPAGPYFRFHILGSTEDTPAISDVATFLYDFNMLYEILRLAVDPERKPRYTYYLTFRNRQRVPHEERLRTVSLRVESPPELVAILETFRLPITITTLSLLLKHLPDGIRGLSDAFDLVEKVRNRHLARRLLAGQVTDVEQRVRRGQLYPLPPEEAQNLLNEREATPLVEWTSRRLRSDKIQITQLELDFVDGAEDDAADRESI